MPGGPTPFSPEGWTSCPGSRCSPSAARASWRATETARRVEAGLVWVNGSGRKPLGVPFGGYKESGIGREGSIDELLSYTRKKSVVVNYATS